MYNPSASYHHQSMANHGIHGGVLEVNVIGCHKLKDTEWISRQDPYVCIDYGSNRSRTRVCTDGSKNPIFQEKFVYSLIEGLREMNVMVWNSNTVQHDDFIGSGKVQLGKVLSHGFDDTAWPLASKTGRYAGEVRLIMHYTNVNNPSYATSAPPPYLPSSGPHISMYSTPPPSLSMSYPPHFPPTAGAYSAPPVAYWHPPESTGYPPNSGGYPYPSPVAPYHPPPPYGSHPPPYPGGYPPPY